MSARQLLMDPQQRARYAPRASQTTAEHPWPVRLLAENVQAYIDKMPALWVEGQVVELKRRPGTRLSFLTLRDTDVEASFTLKIFAGALPPTVKEGDRVVVNCKPDFYPGNGSLSLFAQEMRLVGLGQLLAQIEALKAQLAAEGLFAPARKRPLPFLPRQIGLICGRGAKAQADVLQNVERRWPGMSFVIREVAVQGPHCVAEVCAALTELDALPTVDVIILTRGGGSVEDLLPFSNETLVRTAAACQTPLVSAIGHEEDCPLLDFVADFRASTPTDAAKRVVPDAQAEYEQVALARHRLCQALANRLQTEARFLAQLRRHPALANPAATLNIHARDLHQAHQQLRSSWQQRLLAQQAELTSLRSALRALSPLGTLERGFAVLRRADGEIVRQASSVSPAEKLEAIVAQGRIELEVLQITEGSLT